MIFVPFLIVAAAVLVIWLRPWPLFGLSGETNDASEQPIYRNVALDFAKWVERQALARGLHVRGVARPVPVECPKCRKTSNYFIYPDELCERCWRATLKPVSTPIKSNRL
jgi:hypothetical protein